MSNPQRPKDTQQSQQTAPVRPSTTAERKKALTDNAPTIPRYGPASTQSPSSKSTTQQREFIADAPNQPVTGTQRLRAEPYVASRQLQQKQMRRFAQGGSDPFYSIAHKVDLIVRPALAVLVLLFNIILQFVWAALQLCSALLPDDARRHLQHKRAPELRADHPLAAVLLFALLIWLVGGITQPILWKNTDPRGFDYAHRTWAPGKSDPLKAVDLLRTALGVLAPVTVPAAAPAIQPALPVRPAGDHNVQGAPSITVDQINQILASYNSPAAGSGQAWYDLGEKYQIDPAYAIAFFIHESSAGTASNWAGLKSDGGTTHNIGNIICAGYGTCYGRFRDYPSWEAGIEDWYRLISVEYIQGRGTVTVEQIVPIYAPSFENNVEGYVSSVTTMVDGWRANGVR